MDPLTIAAGAAVVALLVGGGQLGARANRRAILERILGRVEGRLRAGLFSDIVEGRHDGREFRLSLSTSKRWRPFKLQSMSGAQEPAWTDVHPIEVELVLQHAPPVSVRVRRDQGLASLEKAVGLATDVEVAGGTTFDRRFVVEVQGAKGETPLADKEVRGAIADLLGQWRLDEVRVERGRLLARGAPELIGPRQLSGLLVALNILAHAFDRRPALELGLAGQFVWAGGADATARCPFCKDALGDPASLVGCERCRTMLHAECHDENGGCPIFGCGERSATRDPGKGGLDLV